MLGRRWLSWQATWLMVSAAGAGCGDPTTREPDVEADTSADTADPTTRTDTADPADSAQASDTSVPTDATLTTTPPDTSETSADTTEDTETTDVVTPQCPTVVAPGIETPGHLYQRQPYQVVLRDWLATLTVDDFRITITDQDPDVDGVQTLAYDPDYFSGPERAERLFAFYLAADGRGIGLPRVEGIRLPPEGFTLAELERTDADGNGYVRMRIGRIGNNGMLEPTHTVWWALWDYPKNPIHQGANKHAALLRAFVASAVDLIMRDGTLDDVPVDQPAYGWSTQAIDNPLTHYAYSYWAIKDQLDPCVRAAYETGLRRWVKRVGSQSMSFAAGNNDIPQHVHIGLYYAALAIGDPALTAEAVAISKAVLSPPSRSPTGYVTHSPANEISWSYDPAYEGITLHHLSGGVAVSRDDDDWQFLRDLMIEELALKAHQTLVEPDGAQVSPSHYANATSAGVTHDQWNDSNRDYALAMVSPESHYLVFEPRTRAGGYREYRVGLPDDATLEYEARISCTWTGASDYGATLGLWPHLNTPLDWTEVPWGAISWSEGLTGAYFPKPGFYAELLAARDANAPDNLTPFKRAPFVRNFGEEFTFAKLDAGDRPFGVIIHTGQVTRQWGNSDPSEVVTGLGGGELSAFWTPTGGAAWLGWIHGYQDNQWGSELWSDWKGWTAHVVTGVTATGIFTSGRIAIPDVTRTTGADGAIDVAVHGTIDPADPNQFAAQVGALAAPIDYRRTFHVGEAGVDIATTLTADGSDTVSELSETLPLFIADDWYQNVADVAPTLVVETTSGSVTLDVLTADDSPISDVVVIHYRRFQGGLDVTFDRPRTIVLGPYVTSTQYQWGPQSRVVRVDLLDGGPTPLTEVSLSYRVSPAN